MAATDHWHATLLPGVPALIRKVSRRICILASLIFYNGVHHIACNWSDFDIFRRFGSPKSHCSAYVFLFFPHISWAWDRDVLHDAQDFCRLKSPNFGFRYHTLLLWSPSPFAQIPQHKYTGRFTIPLAQNVESLRTLNAVDFNVYSGDMHWLILFNYCTVNRHKSVVPSWSGSHALQRYITSACNLRSFRLRHFSRLHVYRF